METIPLKPCPHCAAPARLCQEPSGRRWHFVGCSNEDDCKIWPVTYAHETAEQAAAAWEKGETF